MRRFTLIGAAFAVLVGGLVDRACSDQRSFVWTYEYQTMERGAAELESYFTLSALDASALETTTGAEHQFELEVGMTDHFDFALYQVFSQEPEQDLKYEEFKLRTRWRFGEKGRYPLDPLIYFEYIGKPNFSQHALEGKLILARDIGKITLALNPILEAEKEGSHAWEFEPKYAAGLGYRWGSLFRAGLEAKGSEASHYLGPVLTHGRDGLWMSLGSAFKIIEEEEDQADFQIRLLVGVGLR